AFICGASAHSMPLDPSDGAAGNAAASEAGLTTPRLHRRLSRLRHAAHDGRGLAPEPGGSGISRQRLLEVSGLSPDACRMAGLLATRPHPALVLFSGRRGSAVFASKPNGPRAIAASDDAACRLARDCAHSPWEFSAFNKRTFHADKLHVRR